MVRAALVLFVFFLATPLQAAWQRAESPNFIVYGNSDQTRLHKFIADLEKFATILRLVAKVEPDPGADKLTVFVLSDVSAVEKAMGPGGQNVAGFYRANIMGAHAVVPRRAGDGGQFDMDAQTILFHEYAHHFMLQYFPTGYPAWYVEGFAEFYSTTEFKSDGSIGLGLPALHRVDSLDTSDIFPLKRMLSAEPGKMSVDEVSRYYAWSWMLTHYLTFDKARVGQLNTYLKAVGNGTAMEASATEAFGDIETLQRDLIRYREAATRRITTRVIKGLKLPETKLEMVQLDAAESEMMPLRIQFARGSGSDAAVKSFVESARKFAVRFPTHPVALELLAEGELDAENLPSATKANDALIALRPTDARAMLRQARIALEQQRDKGDFPGGWPAVRRLIVKANKASPNDAFALSTFYETFAREGVPPTENASLGLARAVQLAPQVEWLRMTLASNLLMRNQRLAAENVLRPLLNHPHNAEIREAARTMLASPALTNDKAGDVKSNRN
jgi:hypothetical protein